MGRSAPQTSAIEDFLKNCFCLFTFVSKSHPLPDMIPGFGHQLLPVPVGRDYRRWPWKCFSRTGTQGQRQMALGGERGRAQPAARDACWAHSALWSWLVASSVLHHGAAEGAGEAAWSVGPGEMQVCWAALPACTTPSCENRGARADPSLPGPSGLLTGGNRRGVWPLEDMGKEESVLTAPCANSIPSRILAED